MMVRGEYHMSTEMREMQRHRGTEAEAQTLNPEKPRRKEGRQCIPIARLNCWTVAAATRPSLHLGVQEGTQLSHHQLTTAYLPTTYLPSF